MTPAFGGQYSIQLSYGRFVGALFYRLNDNSLVTLSNWQGLHRLPPPDPPRIHMYEIGFFVVTNTTALE